MRGPAARARCALPGSSTGRNACATAALTLLMAACGREQPLPRLGQVPDFQLTSQAGQTVKRQMLAGHVWVADFMFTTCPGPCPRMSSQMHEVQTATAKTPDVKLVSFTVDPAHDTPAVLAAYSKHFLADHSRWYFLTGPQASLNDLGLTGFKLNPVDGSLNHSTRFVLVDRTAQIRGYYLSSDDDFIKRLLHDLRQLESEKS
jgi:protein SCO1